MAQVQAVEFLKSFRFRVDVNGKPISIARIGALEVFDERHGNRRVKPVVLEGAPRVGGVGLAAFVHHKGRSTVDVIEVCDDGSVGRRILMTGCRFRRYELEEKDAMQFGSNDAGVVIERVTIHPLKVRVTAPAKGID